MEHGWNMHSTEHELQTRNIIFLSEQTESEFNLNVPNKENILSLKFYI